MEIQLTNEQKAELEKQQYRIIGNHSAVKVCRWTKNSIAGKGSCYKEKFYGIKSHQCMQMTTSMYCANRCKFCWRGQKAPVSKSWYGKIDAPEFIIEESIKNHIKLLQGFKGMGSENTNKKNLAEMKNVRHVALSLTGEPITYPKINQLIEEFHKRKISTFVVTNGQFPDELEKLAPVTQLYLSIDAPNKKILKKIDNPLFDDYWERLIKSLKIFKNKKCRTAIRLTLIRNENICEPENYAELIKIAEPDFVEVKSYMWVGESQKQYTIKAMPYMNEIRDFTSQLLKHLPDYEFADEHLPSRVALIMKKGAEKNIDFDNFFGSVNKN